MTYPDQARTASPAPAAGPAAGPPADPSAGPGRAGGPQPGGTGTPDLVVRTDTAVLTLRAVGPAAVGRDPGAAVYLEDDRVSWEHAVLRPAGDRWVLEDLGSSNGTFADGEEAARIEITASREIRLGDPAEGPLLRCHLETATGRARAVAGPGSPATGSAPAAPDGPAAEAPKGRFGLRRLGRRR
jgi:hypothetical protein